MMAGRPSPTNKNDCHVRTRVAGAGIHWKTSTRLMWMLMASGVFTILQSVQRIGVLVRSDVSKLHFASILPTTISSSSSLYTNTMTPFVNDVQDGLTTSTLSHPTAQESSLLSTGGKRLLDETTTSISTTTLPPRTHPRYHQVPEVEFQNSALKYNHTQYRTAYRESTVVEAGYPWFKSQRICKDSCCAETVAVSLDQDDHHIINTLDGLELSDVMMRKYKYPTFHYDDFFGVHLRDEILPCLQPGTIVHIDNHSDLLGYFFKHYRLNITVPYLLITSESDGDNPFQYGEMLQDDDQLIAWLGLSPNIERIPEEKREVGKQKFIGFPLGLSKQHDQDRYLSRYLELTNYTNPFANKERWTRSFLIMTNTTKNPSLVDEIFYQSAYIHFGINHGFTASDKVRQPFYENLCSGINNIAHKMDNMTCSLKIGQQGRPTTPHQGFVASSRYLFGFSPEGVGWDCYRTYELLLVGVIPVVPKRKMGVQGMFDDLPVLQLEDFDKNRTREEYLEVFREYIASPEFQNADFEAGWKQLFLRHWRRKVLDLTGRTKGIVVDPSTGKEYYQGWRYTSSPIEKYGLTEEEREISEK